MITAKYTELAAANQPGPRMDQLHARAWKAHLFTVIRVGTTAPSTFTRAPTPDTATVSVDAAALAKDLLTSSFMSDRLVGFKGYLEIPSITDRDDVIAATRAAWCSHPISTEAFIGTLASVDSEATPATLTALMDEDGPDAVFKMSLAGHARGVARAWGGQRKWSVLSDAGLAFTLDLMVRIGKVNQMSAYSLLSTFSDVGKFSGEQQEKLLSGLAAARDKFDPVEEQS